MNRPTLTLIGAVTALAAVTGVAALTVPEDSSGSAADSAPAAKRLPVERSTLICPKPPDSQLAETEYTAFTPKGGSGKGSAEMFPADYTDPAAPADGEGKKDKKEKGVDTDDAKAKAVLPLKEPGKPVTVSTERSDAPALIGSADGRFAPGWSVQQTTTVSAGAGRGLHGVACAEAGTDFWFPGASAAEERQDYVHLTNPDQTAAVVDLELHGKDGRIKSDAGEEISVPPRSTVPVLLSTLTAEPVANVAVHAVARTGRVAAQVQVMDQKLGGDWLPPAAVPGPTAVLPGIPGDSTSVRLVVTAPGGKDADLKVRLAAPSGQFTPAGQETLHVKAGKTAAVDLKDLTRGEAGSLILSPSGNGGEAPIVAAVRVTRGKGAKQETAFIPSTAQVEKRATAVGNRAKESTLSLAAPGKSAKVRVTASPGTGGGTAGSETYTVKAGATLAVTPPSPKGGKGAYALTIKPLSGGEVYAARTLAREQDGVPMFTVQSLPDDKGTVAVPEAGEDLSMLTD
ncbi:DUF5719 family protein [Streptomyces sp. N2-109]|uniref:DUF5719 family protein n=1 Tax=Streptomyces gossypii TaxID=2883101 RepID=A0ABT2K2B7_9ACTN|nr:DUF5719 family protein [Streptomyces gossypii]MCT2593604.1 DUF5719 family protein [Streptomyces gossypii]